MVLLGLYLAGSRALVAQLSWVAVGLADMLLGLVWLVLVVRTLNRLGLVGARKQERTGCLLSLGVLLVLVPATVAGLAWQPWSFWLNHPLFDEAATKIEAGEFESEMINGRKFVRLPEPYERLVQGHHAWVFEHAGSEHVIFVETALAGDFTGYCRVPKGNPLPTFCTATPVWGGRGVWFRVVRN